MPPRPPINDTALVKLTFKDSTSGRLWNLIHHAQAANLHTPITPAELHTLSENVIGAFAANLMGYLSPQEQLVSVSTVALGNGDTAFDETSPDAPVVGGKSGTVMPLNVCIAISWTGFFRWRGGKPRQYLSGITSDRLANSASITTAAANELEGDALGYIAALHGSTPDTTPGFVSYHSNNVPRTPPVFFAWQGCNVHQRLDSQRRRLGKESSYGEVFP